MWNKANVQMVCVESEQDSSNTFGKRTVSDGELRSGIDHAVRMAGTKVWERNGALYFEVIAPSTTIIHNEQGPITLKQGTYRISQQAQSRAQVGCASGD